MNSDKRDHLGRFFWSNRNGSRVSSKTTQPLGKSWASLANSTHAIERIFTNCEQLTVSYPLCVQICKTFDASMYVILYCAFIVTQEEKIPGGGPTSQEFGQMAFYMLRYAFATIISEFYVRSICCITDLAFITTVPQFFWIYYPAPMNDV